MDVNTTINLRNMDGTLIDLATRILALRPTLSGTSIIDEITSPTGNGFIPGDVKKKSRRTQTKYTANAAIGTTSGFAGASSQVVGTVSIGKIYRMDNIIASRVDLTKLREGNGGDIIAMDVADFLLTARELDVKELLLSAATKAGAAKIYTSVTKANAGDVYATVANGVQPVQADNKYTSALTALETGKRIILCNELDADEDNRINLIRGAIGYANTIGSDESVESFYPFSINGIPLESIKLLGKYKSIIKIKDTFTTTVVNLNNPGTARSLNALVAYIDTIAVMITNQMGKDVEYTIMSNRVLSRDLDPVTQYVGVINENAAGLAVKIADGTTETVKPSEIVVAMESGRLQGVVYHEEFWQIKVGA